MYEVMGDCFFFLDLRMPNFLGSLCLRVVVLLDKRVVKDMWTIGPVLYTIVESVQGYRSAVVLLCVMDVCDVQTTL